MKVGQAFPSKYLSAADLNGKTHKLTIESYSMEDIGDEKHTKPVLYFRGAKKSMVVNITNASMIQEVLGSDEMDDWIGKEVSIYPTKVDFKGKLTDAIRVKYSAPPPPDALSGENPDNLGGDDDTPF